MKENELLPEGPNYGAWDYAKDPSMWSIGPVELIILWKLGYIRPSISVVFLVMLPFAVGTAASVIGLLLISYIFLIPLSICIAILILAITPMLLESWRTHLSIGTIASLRSRDRGRQINMALIAVAIVAVMLLFTLYDSGAFENGARLQITVESIHVINTVNYVVCVDNSPIESGVLEPRESTIINYVHRWSSPEPTNVTISVEWSLFLFPSDFPFDVPTYSSEKVLTVVHGGFFAADLYV